MMTIEQIEQYLLAAFEALEKYGLEKAVFWRYIAAKAGIPDEHEKEMMDMILYRGYITKTYNTEDSGPLIVGQPIIAAAIVILREK